MRVFPTALLQHLQARGARDAHLMVWVGARNKVTDEAETIGFWTGKDHRTFDVGDGPRTYYGAGAVLEIPLLISETGVSVRTTRIIFSSIAEEVAIATNAYDLYKGSCEMHLAHFDPVKGILIDDPTRIYKGSSAGLQITRAKKGERASAELALLSAAETLTRTLPLKKSHEAQIAKTPDDKFRQYTDISGAVEVVWGEVRAKAPSPAVSPPNPGTTSTTYDHSADR